MEQENLESNPKPKLFDQESAVEHEDLKSNPKPKLFHRDSVTACIVLCIGVPTFILWLIFIDSHKIQIPEIELVSIDFAATVHNDSTRQQSLDPLIRARLDLSIRVPKELFGNYMCLQGNLQASFLYKNVTLVTSSNQSYNILKSSMPQLLNVSAVASEEDLSGAIGKEIMEAIKERSEMRFGSRFSLSDCRKETKKSTMNYECGEATLRFDSVSDQIKATAFGNHLSCIINL